MKTLLYVALCLVVPPVWAVITYFAFNFLHGKLKPGKEGPDPRAAR